MGERRLKRKLEFRAGILSAVRGMAWHGMMEYLKPSISIISQEGQVMYAGHQD
jgi:hypothetical protein